MFTGRAKQVTIFFGESDTYRHQSLYSALIETLRREGYGGATALRGVAGFGASSLIHTSAILRLSMDLPMLLMVIERPERVERLLALLREMAPTALVTVQDVEVVQSGVAFKEGLPDIKVGEVMRREVVTVRPDSPLTAVVELLLDKDFTAVPVVDEQGRVVGMVSDNDLLTRGGMQVTLSLKRATDAEFVRELHQSLRDPRRQVGAVMTPEVVSVGPETGLGEAGKLMVEKHLKRLPVVDGAGKLVGILGRLDILNTIAAVHLPQWHPEARRIGLPATVAEVMSRDVPTLGASATLEAIFNALVSSAHKRVVIVDEQRRVVGIIADSDLISRVSRESWPGIIEILIARVPLGAASVAARQHLQKIHARTAEDLMTREVLTVRDTMPVASALALSAERRIKRMPVVDGDGLLVGIVGRSEMMRALLA